jgi:hypothetical protein
LPSICKALSSISNTIKEKGEREKKEKTGRKGGKEGGRNSFLSNRLNPM